MGQYQIDAINKCIQNYSTWTITIIAATIGGPINIDKAIPFIMSLKNNHTVCCTAKNTFKNYNKLITHPGKKG